MPTAIRHPTGNGTQDWDEGTWSNLTGGSQPTRPSHGAGNSLLDIDKSGNNVNVLNWAALPSTWTVTEVKLWRHRWLSGKDTAVVAVDVDGDLGALDAFGQINDATSPTGGTKPWLWQSWDVDIDCSSGTVAPVVTHTSPAMDDGDKTEEFTKVYLEFTYTESGGGGGGGSAEGVEPRGKWRGGFNRNWKGGF